MAGEPELKEILNQIGALKERVRESEGARLAARLGGVARMYRVFLGNHRELVGLLGNATEPETALRLWDIQKRKEFDSFLDEVDRLLHNYLASTMALVEHTRRLVNREGGPEDFLSGYESAKASLFATPLATFVHGLRNYTLHRELAVVHGELSWTPDQPLEDRVMLEQASLLEWKGWSVAAQRFIASGEGDINLLTVIEQYSHAVMRFHDWFGFNWVRTRIEPFREFHRLSRRLAKLYAKAGLVDD